MRAPLQFVLDFFTGGDPVQPTRTPKITAGPTNAADARSSASPPHATLTPSTGDNDASLPQPEPSPWGFTHPTANRHVQLQGVTVSYRFERSRRKSIGFLVGADGLVVRAPNWVPLRVSSALRAPLDLAATPSRPPQQRRWLAYQTGH